MKKTMLVVCLLAPCHLLFGQAAKTPRSVHTTEKSAIHVPGEEIPAALTKIYSNLGSSATDLYYDTDGLPIQGPDENNGYAIFEAMQFTPAADSHVSQVRVAVQYYGVGTNQVDLNIYSDADGVPGTLLAGPAVVKNLADFGTCCTLAIGSFTPVAVTAGTRYWVVANTPATGSGSDAFDIWDTVVQGKTLASSVEADGTWYQEPGLLLPAGEVLGTVP